MPYFTKYAEEKFQILNKHKVYFTREQIEDVIKLPSESGKNGNYFYCIKDGIKVILRKEQGINKIITFFPVK